ncbi:hypothetical protein [Streptomyces mirabilis]|uniref:hypothetical protein n=1 Tax=Streptomyces mirabilis TaxID=68239 RepID=UPI0036B1B3E3
MDPFIVGMLAGLAMRSIVAAAAVLITRHAIKDTESRDRAAVLEGVGTIIRSIRGKR